MILITILCTMLAFAAGLIAGRAACGQRTPRPSGQDSPARTQPQAETQAQTQTQTQTQTETQAQTQTQAQVSGKRAASLEEQYLAFLRYGLK